MILPEKLSQHLIQLHQQRTDDSTLPSRTQLTQYYDTFRQRFGPDKLQDMDGEALLETLHNHSNRDSLVYWLEFKNDDEFPAIFGSIAGGSALKFGLYKRKETGAWMTGSPQKQQELPLREAIEMARKHRDQLLKGAELLAQLPILANDDYYRQLQEQMDVLTPDVSQKAWGHKYFSLLYPDKLDDYHSPDYQDFHLIKLLQLLPSDEGRYLAAGRFVAIAAELNMPLNHLTTLLNERNGTPYRYWRVGTSDSTTPRNRWALMRDGNCVAVGWSKLGDLSDLDYNQVSKEKIRAAIGHHYPNTPQMIGRQTQEVFNFAVTISVGDLVLAADGGTILGLGRVEGDYAFASTSDFPHRRPVTWLSLDEWALSTPEGLRTTVHEMKKDVKNLIEVEQRLLQSSPPPPTIIVPQPATAVVHFSGIPGRIQVILERKQQVILYGPPGTGKTYWAVRTAHDLAAYARFGQPFADLSIAQQAIITSQPPNGEGLVRLCAFHPAYGYEDFLEGYRPQPVNGQLHFERQDGLFKKLCTTANQQPTNRFYLIIDEINRGDIPRIFGELLTVLEKDKRGQSILLPLSGQPFHVPDNVYLIGTMNTADRSIALLDTALRRRFGFVELMPDSHALGQTVVESIPLGPWLDALNTAICENIGRDARNLQIGHAYLLENDQPVTSFAKLARIIQDDILPLLEEYCYEDYAALARILPGLVDERQQRVRHELFDPARKDELIQVLKAIDPNLATSPQAVASDARVPDTDLMDEADDTAEGSSSS